MEYVIVFIVVGIIVALLVEARSRKSEVATQGKPSGDESPP